LGFANERFNIFTGRAAAEVSGKGGAVWPVKFVYQAGIQ
jgi:hypothetical protein